MEDIIKRWEAKYKDKCPVIEGHEREYLAIIDLTKDGFYNSYLYPVYDNNRGKEILESPWSTSIGAAKKRFSIDGGRKASSLDWRLVIDNK